MNYTYACNILLSPKHRIEGLQVSVYARCREIMFFLFLIFFLAPITFHYLFSFGKFKFMVSFSGIFSPLWLSGQTLEGRGKKDKKICKRAQKNRKTAL